MAEKDGSTMTAEERLARAWQLFEEAKEQRDLLYALMVATRDYLRREPRLSTVALTLAESGVHSMQNSDVMDALGDMLRPEGVAA